MPRSAGQVDRSATLIAAALNAKRYPGPLGMPRDGYAIPLVAKLYRQCRIHPGELHGETIAGTAPANQLAGLAALMAQP